MPGHSFAVTAILAISLALTACGGRRDSDESALPVTPFPETLAAAEGDIAHDTSQGVRKDRSPREERFLEAPEGVRLELWASELEVPWSIVFLSADEALVSERPGRIRRISGGRLDPEPWATVRVASGGERGLMSLAVHPRFPQEPWIYAMLSVSDRGADHVRVVRFRHTAGRGTFDRIVFDTIPGSQFHDGGRIAFGPDGMLYVCTGDAGVPAAAQDLKSLSGKILRITPEGRIPPDNPFPNSPVYALGFRNPQGLAWHPSTGELIASDHGPTGEEGRQAHDEINLVRPGGNYGWPRVIGAAGDPEFVDPLVVWPRSAVPPGGIAFVRETLFVATLASEALISIPLAAADGGLRVGQIERWFTTEEEGGVHGRLRDAVRGPDGALYVTTSNRDGRGRRRSGDDRILRLQVQ
jgi:glucose/arabinose dehydrogenase